MTKYLVVDREECYGISVCDTKDEVIEGCGYEVDEITFEELCEQVSGIYDIVEVTGDFQLNWLIKEQFVYLKK